MIHIIQLSLGDQGLDTGEVQTLAIRSEPDLEFTEGEIRAFIRDQIREIHHKPFTLTDLVTLIKNRLGAAAETVETYPPFDVQGFAESDDTVRHPDSGIFLQHDGEGALNHDTVWNASTGWRFGDRYELSDTCPNLFNEKHRFQALNALNSFTVEEFERAVGIPVYAMNVQEWIDFRLYYMLPARIHIRMAEKGRVPNA